MIKRFLNWFRNLGKDLEKEDFETINQYNFNSIF